jgi:hypothetical protein
LGVKGCGGEKALGLVGTFRELEAGACLRIRGKELAIFVPRNILVVDIVEVVVSVGNHKYIWSTRQKVEILKVRHGSGEMSKCARVK